MGVQIFVALCNLLIFHFFIIRCEGTSYPLCLSVRLCPALSVCLSFCFLPVVSFSSRCFFCFCLSPSLVSTTSFFETNSTNGLFRYVSDFKCEVRDVSARPPHMSECRLLTQSPR